VALGLSQSRLAALTGMYQMRMSRLEMGALPTVDEARRIAAVLGVPVEQLFHEGRHDLPQ
jgi:transcriptional regulator with XRE-family HTH domain